MHEDIASYINDTANDCSTLLKKSQDYANDIARHKATIHTPLRQIREQLYRLEKFIEYLKRAEIYLPPVKYQTQQSDIIMRRKIYAITHLTDIVDIIAIQDMPRTEEELAEKDSLYLQIISLFNELENREHAANTLTRVCIMINHFFTEHRQFMTKEKITQLYKSTCYAIKMYPMQNLPKELPITDIFEMFARALHHENPLLARDILLAALDHSKNGYCHHKNAIYLCLKGLAANYMKLVDRRYGYINDENADQEIDACYQIAINYLKQALDFQTDHSLQECDGQDCFIMLSSAYIRLAKHYECLYSKIRAPELTAHIEHWYSGAIHWAHEAGDKRKAGIACSHLAHHFLRQNKVVKAYECLQKAMYNLLQDLDAQPVAPLQLNAMRSRYQQLLTTPQIINDQAISICLQLINDLIALGDDLKYKETQRFYRFVQPSNHATPSTSPVHFPSKMPIPGNKR